jgi:hypothetical protein
MTGLPLGKSARVLLAGRSRLRAAPLSRNQVRLHRRIAAAEVGVATLRGRFIAGEPAAIRRSLVSAASAALQRRATLCGLSASTPPADSLHFCNATWQCF